MKDNQIDTMTQEEAFDELHKYLNLKSSIDNSTENIRDYQRLLRSANYRVVNFDPYYERKKTLSYNKTLFKKYSRYLSSCVKDKARVTKRIQVEFPSDYVELVREKKGDMDYAKRWKDRKF